jgi:CRP-like cAMP-binding protein
VDRQKNATPTNLDLLSRLKPLSSLSAEALRELASGLNPANFQRRDVILREEAPTTGIHILLKGVAKITCLNRCGERVTVALLAPGPIPEFLSLPVSRWHFRCEAYSDCRVGSPGWDRFNAIALKASEAALFEFYRNSLRFWYRLLLRGSTFLNLSLRERIEITLLELCEDFGIKESRGTLLSVFISHGDLADMVGASRPRVTEHLAELERERVVIRQGRQLIVRSDKLENPTSVPLPDTDDSFAKASIQPHFPKASQLYGLRSPAASRPERKSIAVA